VTEPSFLSPGWFGEMADMGGSDMQSLPFTLADQGSSFRYGRTTGYIAEIALRSPYRGEADAIASSLGYQIGQWPLVPLQGDVVKDNRGTLEVYQTHLAFGSREGASAFVAGLRDSDESLAVIPPEMLSILGEGALEFIDPGDPASGLETDIGVDFQLGETVAQLTLRGGADVNSMSALQAAVAADAQLKKQCGNQL
jgi:hypothetical protein